MKKLLEFFKSLFATKEKVITSADYAELKKELKAVNKAQASTPVVEEAPKAKKEVVVAEEAAPKKKKRYYKPKNKA